MFISLLVFQARIISPFMLIKVSGEMVVNKGGALGSLLMDLLLMGLFSRVH